MKKHIFAIIPAAGQGSRMGARTNKQFLELLGIPVIIRTLLAFEKSAAIDGILVVTNLHEQETLESLCRKYSITKLIGVTFGGETRQDSVRNALRFLISYTGSRKPVISVDDCRVLIHDGARPFVSEEVIRRCVEGVEKHDACGAGVKVKDTIKIADPESGLIIKTLPREQLWAIQTPQAFSLPLIERLHIKAFSEKLSFTDDLSIAEHYGENVYIIDGDYRNIKITTPDDLEIGEFLIKNNGLK
ncbi:MAG: 2-C-methyl-D-erythritol 4-phosphate cytidylyltransferase [Saccharofermentanales bacterium]